MGKRFNMQLFADEPATTGPAEPTEPKPAEPTEPKQQKEPKDAEPKRYTEADVNAIIDKKFAEWQKKQQKVVDEAKKLAEMNAQEKAEYERDQLQQELDSLKKQASISEMTRTARKMLSDEGINVPDELVSALVAENAEDTKMAVNNFAKAFTAAVEAAVKDRLKGEPPKRGSGSTPTMTKEQILAIKDTDLRQQMMLENRHLFNL